LPTRSWAKSKIISPPILAGHFPAVWSLCARRAVYDHLEAAIKSGESLDVDRFFTSEQEKEIAAAFRQILDGKLIDVSALLGNKYDIGLLRIFRAFATRGIINL
jgi:hypothetical protein